MEQHRVPIKSIEKVTHNVLGIAVERPANYTFEPGQATEVAIDKDGWREEGRPFTFTCLPEDDHLEFTIKTYPEHDGVTNQLRKLKAGDQLLLHDVFGAIKYKGEGSFVAGGAGVTPFIAIFRHLHQQGTVGNNRLLFANKRKEDIILKDYFEKLLGKNFINILSEDEAKGYVHGYMTKDFLQKHIEDTGKPAYVCGPPPMMDNVTGYLNDMGVSQEAMVLEQ